MRIKYPIDTARLRLAPFTLTDGDALYVLESDPAVKRFTGGVLTRDETEQLLQRFVTSLAQTGLGTIAIKQQETERIIGLCGLVQEADATTAEIFFGLALTAWGQGFATEACHGLIEAGFQQLGLRHVIATVHPENTQSIRVLERLGMQLLPTLTNKTTAADERVYTIAKNLSPFTPEAAKLWAKVPDHVKPTLLDRVWCTYCQAMTTIIHFAGEVVAGDLVLSGTCQRCGGKVARLLESD